MKRQSGITLIGFVIILVILAFFGYTAMKLVPPYIEYMGVVKAMNQVASEPDTASKSPEQIRADLGFKGSFQYVDDDTLGADSVHIVSAPGGASSLQAKWVKIMTCFYKTNLWVHSEKPGPLKMHVQP